MPREKFEVQDERDFTDEIVAAGIGDRVLATLQKYNGPTPFAYGLSDLRFLIAKDVPDAEDLVAGDGPALKIVVQMPNKHVDITGESFVTQAFAIERGRSFGAGDEAPLTDEQFDLVSQLANEA